ncbi:hypothetical protein [Roseateles paludis]|jgi:hypothetical protein|uniref:Uncharacterized protein n=1 Tax=Roseateles paludis TaxID=3145238 RepID=A0ABV0G7D5_9BURK
MRFQLRLALISTALILGGSSMAVKAAPEAKPAATPAVVPADGASKASAGGSKQAPEVKAGGSGGGAGSARSASATAIKPKLPKCPDPTKCQAEKAAVAQ